MKSTNFHFIFLLPLILSSWICYSQDSTTIRSIWDIPHKSIFQKWMWIHRAVTYEVVKDRPINYDTNYIKSYHKKLVITIPISYKKLQFSILDFKSGNKLTFAPNQQFDFGISISSRWATFILNTGAKLFSRDNEIKGKTSYQDYQLNLYNRKITTDMFFQTTADSILKTQNHTQVIQILSLTILGLM